MFCGWKSAKNVPAKTKLEDARQLRRQVLKHSDWNNGPELPNFSLNLDYGNFENETPNKRVKKVSEEELDKSVEDQKYQYKQANTICTTYLANMA